MLCRNFENVDTIFYLFCTLSFLLGVYYFTTFTWDGPIFILVATFGMPPMWGSSYLLWFSFLFIKFSKYREFFRSRDWLSWLARLFDGLSLKFIMVVLFSQPEYESFSISFYITTISIIFFLTPVSSKFPEVLRNHDRKFFFDVLLL